ncbi:GNAT family N-acetyltransferase [Burkholderia sp. Ac-20384]|uniref:GNAT family N-acetyltransferase n=1 Tax=Burkholderia sp. Ac-20384 TaxID=2703902 RepID=UPI00197E9074|nr:GNAT family N-acetyltransferase [Burkholderia sp. Ac-20384]MBN3828232.1 GNAT family N-acetyltransferase [Burkholderia sp. Ac-20384]
MYTKIDQSPVFQWLSSPLQIFETDRFQVVALSGSSARSLLAALLQDEALASRVDWMEDKSTDGALREAFGIELQCNAGQTRVWSIVDRAKRMQIGAVMAKHSIEGLDVDVLVASRFWDQGVSGEVAAPVMEWLEKEANLALQ